MNKMTKILIAVVKYYQGYNLLFSQQTAASTTTLNVVNTDCVTADRCRSKELPLFSVCVCVCVCVFHTWKQKTDAYYNYSTTFIIEIIFLKFIYTCISKLYSIQRHEYTNIEIFNYVNKHLYGP